MLINTTSPAVASYGHGIAVSPVSVMRDRWADRLVVEPTQFTGAKQGRPPRGELR